MPLVRRSCLLSLTGAALLGALSCDNSITPLEVLPPLDAASTDSTAGSWQMIVLSGPTQFTVPAPAAETSATYLAELAAIKTVQANLTAAQRQVIDYWSGGGVLRWNEIARGLVARFNLPPAPRADGTYPVPDPENPFADPQFPFANPPYAARAYSYLSVAQYEALKTTWYWKFQYNRRSPAQIDPGVLALRPLSDLPAYPSEDAVLSLGVACSVNALDDYKSDPDASQKDASASGGGTSARAMAATSRLPATADRPRSIESAGRRRASLRSSS